MLESEALKSEESIFALLQPLVDSGNDILELDTFLSLNLLELNEKVASLGISEELPAAPVREELIDAVLGHALQKKFPFQFPELSRSWRMGMDFYFSKKKITA